MNRYLVAYEITHVNNEQGSPAWTGGTQTINACDPAEAKKKVFTIIRGQLMQRKELGPRTKLVIKPPTRADKKW